MAISKVSLRNQWDKRDKDLWDRIEKTLDRCFGKNYEIINGYNENIDECMRINAGAGIRYADGSFPILVRYDEIIVRCEYEQRVKIVNDIFVNFSLRIDTGTFNQSPVFARTTFTDVPDAHANMGHGVGSGYFEGVCMGSGPLSKIIPTLWHKSQFEELPFQAFAVALKAYLEWENIGDSSGFVKQDQAVKPIVHENELSDADKQNIREVLSKCKGHLKENLTLITSPSIEVIIKTPFEKVFGKELHEAYGKKYVCFRTESGTYVEENGNFNKAEIHSGLEECGVFFRGHHYKPIVKDVINEKKSEQAYYPRPEITKFVREEIKSMVYKRLIRDENSSNEGASGDIRKTADADKPHLQAGA